TTSTTTSSSSSSSGSATQGEVSAVEDWNVDVWENPNSSLNVSYEPFNPYATPTAAAETTVTATPEPTSTFVIGTMIPITYEEDTKETQTSTSWVGLVLGGLVLAGGAGGVYAYALTQNKKRKAAARAAAARQRAQQQNGTQNPYARRAAAAAPLAAGQQKKDQNNPYQRPNPYARPQQNAQNPYQAQTPQNPYAQSTQNTARRPNPYAQRPAPYSASSQPQAPQTPQNPYARPQTPEDTATTDTTAGSTQQPRTGRRSDRYKGHDDDNA
ncbi:MAG TPA: hypothetical protein PK537_11110, partial [Candidatus Limiplasma sp.]|nr:hypothetical protein [Candidatus Limiplasma sp.]